MRLAKIAFPYLAGIIQEEKILDKIKEKKCYNVVLEEKKTNKK